MMSTTAINNKQDLTSMSIDELLAEATERLQRIEEITQELKESLGIIDDE